MTDTSTPPPPVPKSYTDFTKITRRFYQNHWLILTKSHPDFTKITLRLYQSCQHWLGSWDSLNPPKKNNPFRVYLPEPYSRWKNIITTKNWIGRIRKLCDERNSPHMSRLVGSHPTISLYDGLVHPVFHPWTYMCS